MRLLELKEAVSSRVFHYTRVTTAVKIVDSGEFQLTSSLGTDWEAQYSPQGYPYYLSTTRTRHGGYHDYLGQDAVLFELDGDFYNQRYPGRAVDYWGNRNPTQDHHRAHEAEDRIFSKTDSIPAKIVAIDLYVSPEADENIRARARRLIISAKRQGIALNFFTDQTAWRQRDLRNTANVNILKGQDDSRGYVGRHRGYLLPWLELVQAKKKSQLSKKANDIRYDLQYTYDKASLAQRLGVDLSNARKPGPDPDRANAVKIIQYMQANKLKTVQDFVDYLADKWKNITEEDHGANIAEVNSPGELAVDPSLIERFTNGGWEIDGEGRDQIVMSRPGSNTVLKIVGSGSQARQDEVRRYVNFFRANQRNPHFPRVGVDKQFTWNGNKYYVYTQERLYSLPGDEAVMDYLEYAMSEMGHGEEPDYEQVPAGLTVEEVDGLVMAVDSLFASGIVSERGFDLGNVANIMQRSNGQLVIVDPASSFDDDLAENFADGKKPGRKGLARRMGVDCSKSETALRKIAKNSTGERQRMAHWCSNMKGGRQ